MKSTNRWGWLRRFGFLRFVDRWGYFILLAIATGILSSWLMFVFTPATSEATSDLFVAARPSPSQSLDTEMKVITSQSVAAKAVELQKLKNLHAFRNKSNEELIAWILARLDVNIVSEDFVRVRVRSDSTELSTEVLAGVVSGYRQNVRERLATDTTSEIAESNLPRVFTTNTRWERPSWFSRIGRGALWGFLISLALGGLVDLTDSRYRDPAEIEEHLGLPVAQHIRTFNARGSTHGYDDSLIADYGYLSIDKESYLWLRNWIASQQGFHNKKVLQITSPIPGDGKSTLAANLAIVMARTGRRVLLIDADLRRRQIQRLFRLNDEVGLRTVLTGQTMLNGSIHSTLIKGLSVLPAGTRPRNPSELLSSPAFEELLRTVRTDFDFVIIDTANLLRCSDACAVAGRVDGVLLTTRLERRTRNFAALSLRMLRGINANVLGIVVSGRTPGYTNAYSYWAPVYSPTDHLHMERYINHSVDEEESNTTATADAAVT